MPIPFECPHCRHRILVDDQFAGMTGPCARCGQTISIPFLTGAAPAAHPAASNDSSQQPIPGVWGHGQTGHGQIQGGTTGGPGGARPRLPRWLTAALILGAGLLLSVAVLAPTIWLVTNPALSSAANASARSRSQANLKRIALALRAYETAHGTLPPAYVAGPDGKPLYSWRVLILPHLGQRKLYTQFDLNASWDSERNLALLPRMPEVFSIPANHAVQGLGHTSYLAVSGPGTAFPGAQPLASSAIRDGVADTLWLIEIKESEVGWTEPEDWDPRHRAKMKRLGRQCGTNPGGHVITADGQAHFLRADTPISELNALSTVAGGERPDWSRYEVQP